MKSFSKILLCSTFIFLLFSIIQTGESAVSPRKKSHKIKYHTTFGQCPSRSAGTLALKLIKTFEESKSLRVLKKRISEEKLDQRHFISDYKITYDPLRSLLKFNFQCPEPLMKVQIYKENGLDSYEAILVESGELFDPTYEVLLRSEKKLTTSLPFLALPVGEIDKETQARIAKTAREMNTSFRKKLSEVIINEKQELTIILSIKGNPSSVFMGNSDWEEKISKLQRIVKFMETKKKIPAIINLTNSKKVVVKFNGKF